MKTEKRKPIESETDILPFAPRNWLSAVKNIFGDSFVIKLFRIEIRTYHRWIAKRPYVDEEGIRENYLEKHEVILKKLMDDGYSDIARAIIAHHAEIAGCTIHPIESVIPDKTNLSDEMLDDYPRITALHQSIQDNESLDTVRHRLEKAKRELDETVELFRSKK